MPLLDHFQPPLKPGRHWESFHSVWCTTIMAELNRRLPDRYFAEAETQVGGRIEVDVPAWEEEKRAAAPGANGGVAIETWAPPATSLVMPTVFPDEFEVRVFDSSGGATLVAAVELVSPANKDRPESRVGFAAKCLAYLQRGIGLVIVDVVTEKRFNLHNQLVDLLQQEVRFAFPGQTFLYSSAFRPARRPAGDQIDVWLHPIVVGQPLPTMPLALRGGPTLPVDLEATYSEARQRSRL